MEMFIKSFEELTTKELYDLLRLRSEVFVVEQNCVYQDCDEKDYHAAQLFYCDNNRVVAGVRLLPRGISYEDASIGRVVVHPDYRRQQLGLTMMKEAIKELTINWKESVIRISAQHYLLQFYESLGFNVVSDVYLEDNIPHVEMVYLNAV